MREYLNNEGPIVLAPATTFFSFLGKYPTMRNLKRLRRRVSKDRLLPATRRAVCGVAMCCLALATWTAPARSQEPPEGERAKQVARRPAKDPPGMIRLQPDSDAWIDKKNKRVVVDGTVVLREGQLEMFACPRGTKEHESIVAVDSKAYPIHAALLAVGAVAGTPVQFQPEYRAAKGTEVDVQVVWTDANGTIHRERAQDWIRNVHTGQAMQETWVFPGSMFWESEAGGTRHYMAESGDLICISNFPTAMLDVPVESSQSNDHLLFQAYTERIPPLGTRVRLVLTPKAKK